MRSFTWISALLLLLYVWSGSANTSRQSRQISANHPGVCRYGRRLECCYGWKKNNKGQCEAQCEHGCEHGECVGPNKCKCFPGYTGRSCSQDLNECGLKPRPCEHRCMNTHGSYMCYCLNGYTLMPDGSCTNSRTCTLANCQYGCEEVQGETRCLCPSTGLQLGPDERSCVDIDECVTGQNLCPFNRRCINTFGSYYCKCQNGYDLKYVDGKYDCVDIDECLSGSHKCSHHAECLNTQGSYKCKCKKGFRGSGVDCTALPDSPVKPYKPDVEQKNVIPEPEVTEAPRPRLQPFDYEGGVYIGGPGENVAKFREEDYGEERGDGGNEENQVDSEEPPRGDVFTAEELKSVYGPPTEVKEIQIDPTQDEFITDCNFDQGACEWMQDQEDDMEWGVSYHDNGLVYYMAVSGLLGEKNDVARLKLLLNDRARRTSSFCLTFNYRLVGHQVGTLRVLLDNDTNQLWEKRHTRSQEWQTELLTITWENEAPEEVIFEAERGRGTEGEIALDNVVLTSGSCQDDDAGLF
ncbi:epidermal growth factor-like protein 6 isoform X2 [Clupea harengus]|uniref:Epidermal growth factor-like protein 6 isoform X2 n=1 Tax=Clupea harengus TaxID=7950 RepID=A0A6P8EKE7_CLUHA|nr:epidermal growth factor-like protein 6 isoform X2 [Clupea harengus]